MRTNGSAAVISVRAMKRATSLLAAAAALLLAAEGLGWLAQRPWFDLREIELRSADGAGLRHVNINAVRAATIGRLRGNFFTMSLEEARRAFETVPWVAAVSIRRLWPDRLRVTLAEHRAIAVWGDGRLLSDAGQLFVANIAEAEVAGPLPQVEAPARFAADVARRLPALAANAEAMGQALEAIEVSERGGWTLRAESGLAIALGRDDPAGRIDERLAAIVARYPAITAQLGTDLAHIDARYPQGFAVAAAPRKKP